ncbi:hypothetical protein CC79DRAFT_158697 [Sarocladium strictum]
MMAAARPTPFKQIPHHEIRLTTERDQGHCKRTERLGWRDQTKQPCRQDSTTHTPTHCCATVHTSGQTQAAPLTSQASKHRWNVQHAPPHSLMRHFRLILKVPPVPSISQSLANATRESTRLCAHRLGFLLVLVLASRTSLRFAILLSPPFVPSSYSHSFLHPKDLHSLAVRESPREAS